MCKIGVTLDERGNMLGMWIASTPFLAFPLIVRLGWLPGTNYVTLRFQIIHRNLGCMYEKTLCHLKSFHILLVAGLRGPQPPWQLGLPRHWRVPVPKRPDVSATAVLLP